MKKRFTEEQIIGILKDQEVGGNTSELCRRHGISDATFCNWRAKYGGMEASDARRLKALELENAKLKKLLAEAELDKAMLKDNHYLNQRLYLQLTQKRGAGHKSYMNLFEV